MGILLNDGDLKWTFSTATANTTLKVTSIIVKTKYFPRRGIARDVEGMISASTKKKKVKDSRMEIDSDTFSPLSDGK